MKKIKTNLLTL